MFTMEGNEGRQWGRPGSRPLQFALFFAACVGVIVGTSTLTLHLQADPLGDVRAYYDAGARLNAGLPLYPAGADPDAPDFYRYPPLLAILFRPLALLSYPAAAATWEVFLIGCLAATLWILGIRSRWTWIATCALASPIAWTMTIGQAQALVTLLTALAAPWSLALAANVKLFPALAALWWVGRRDWRALGWFVAWTCALLLLQLALEPVNTIAFLRVTNLQQVGDVVNLSPYALSPLVWAVLVVVGAVVALRLAPTRLGWPAAVVLSVLATPRLLTYMFITLMAVLARPDTTKKTDGATERGSAPSADGTADGDESAVAPG
jgi:hypothetical protein